MKNPVIEQRFKVTHLQTNKHNANKNFQNSNLKTFLEKYTAQLVLDEGIRKDCIPPIYYETLMSIRNSIGHGLI